MKRAAVDMGGSWIRWRVSDGHEGRIGSGELDPEEILEMLIKQYGVERIGVSFAGQVEGGRVVSSPNLRAPRNDIKKYIFDKYGVSVLIENDMNCAALADADDWGSRHLTALYSGTGLGSGVVERGELLRGVRGIAGEIGHVPFRKAPFLCGCGRDNCLELYASGYGLMKWRNALDCEERSLMELMHSSHEKCRRVAERYMEALLYATGILITLCNPEILVLGGGVVAATPEVVDQIRQRISAYALSESLNDTLIVSSRLENGSLRGAELLVGME